MATRIQPTPPTLDARLFTYHAGTRTFMAECSDLGFAAPPRVLVLVNVKSGNKRGFTFTGAEYDPEGELVAWVFHHSHEGYTLRIYND